MNEYHWYSDTVLDNEHQNNAYSVKKQGIPAWVTALITSSVTTAVLIVVYTILILPIIKSSTTIHYAAPQSPADSVQSVQNDNGMNITAVAEKCIPSTVFVSSTGIIGGFFNQPISLGDGSGVIVSEDGYIITSAAVVNSGSEIKVTLSDGTEIPAMIVGSDREADVAILKIERNGLTPAVLGDSQYTKVGDHIVAIGSPYGPEIRNTVTYGIIAGKNDGIVLEGGLTLNLLQADVNVAQGNAGGALFNANGEIVGIVNGSISSEGGVVFATPVNDVKPLLSSFLNSGIPQQSDSDTPMIGITGTEESYGVVVETVSEDYPAAKAGIKVGDVIIKVDGTPITTVAKINEIRLSHKRGDSMTVTVFRDGETIDLTVVLE